MTNTCSECGQRAQIWTASYVLCFTCLNRLLRLLGLDEEFGL